MPRNNGETRNLHTDPGMKIASPGCGVVLTHTNTVENRQELQGNGLSSAIGHLENVISAFVEVDHRKIRHCREKSSDAKIAR